MESVQQGSSRSTSPALSRQSSLQSLQDDAQFDDEHAEKPPVVDKKCVSYTAYEERSNTKETALLLPLKLREKWSRAAFWVAVFAIFVTMGFCVASFAICRETESSSIFASAFDALLGSFSSMVVVWRFRDAKNGDIAPKREKTATLGIALSFIVTGIATIANSALHLSYGDHPKRPEEIIIILTSSFVCFSALGCVQQCISSKLQSQCLKATAVDSWLAAAMSAGILVSTFVYRTTQPDLWFMDHIVALLIGIISAVYGLKLVIEISVLAKPE